MYNLNDLILQLNQCPSKQHSEIAERFIRGLIVSQYGAQLFLKASKSERKQQYHELLDLLSTECADLSFLPLIQNTLVRILRLTYENKNPTRETPDFSLKIEISSNQVEEVYELVLKEVQDIRSPTPERRLEWALFFCLCSGVCFLELFKELYRILVTVERPVVKIGNLYVIPINYQKDSHFCNVIDEDQLVTQRLFYLDSVAMAAITGFFKVKEQFSPENSSAIRSLSELFARIPAAKDISKLAPKTMLKAFSAWLFRQPGIDLYMWQRGFVEGTVQSASTSLNSLSAQTGHKIKKSQIKHLHVREIAKTKLKTSKVSSAKSDRVTNDNFLKTLRKLIATSRNSISALKIELQKLLEQDISQAQEVMIMWMYKKYEDKEWKKASSAERHLSVLGHTWLSLTLDVQLETLNEAEITQLYEDMLDDKKSDDQKIYASLSSIITFMSMHLGTPVPDSFEGAHVGCVRTAVINESHFQHLLSDIDKTFSKASEHERLCIKMALILMRRLGLRPHELDLLVSDVDIEGLGEVIIRRNLKSPSSCRVLTLEPFFVMDEYKHLCSFINMRKHQARGSKHQSLFTLDPRFGQAIDFQKLARSCSLLLSEYLGEPTPFYQLRHSALSIIQLVLFGDDELIELFTPFSIEQANKIKTMMDIGDQQDRLYQLSSHAGHLNQGISLSTYCHFSDLLLYQQVRKLDRKFQNNFWFRLSGVRPSTFEKFMRKSPAQVFSQSYTPLEVETFVHECAYQINRLTQKRQGLDIMKNVILTDIKEPTPTLADVDTILRTHDEALNLSRVEKELKIKIVTEALGLNEMWGADILLTAKVIKERPEYTTTKGKSRLYPNNGARLAPSKPSCAAEAEDVEVIERKLAKTKVQDRQVVRQSTDMLFQRMTHGHSEIIFSCPLELSKFFHGIRELIPNGRWFVVLNPNRNKESTDQVDIWTSQSNWPKDTEIVEDSFVSDERRYPHGRLNLHFQHPHANKMTFSVSEVGKHSSNALKYVLHLYAILLGAQKRYQKFEKVNCI